VNSAPLVAIHQPNFFPWLGFFDKFARCDVFILLDDVQFPRMSKGVWTNRVAVRVQGRAKWITAPVDRTMGVLPVNRVKTSSSSDWRGGMLATLRHSYARAPRFRDVWEMVEALAANPEDALWSYNAAAIEAIVHALGLDASKIRLASSYNVSGSGTARLVALTRAAGGGGYLCGDGAGGYQEDTLFAEAGLELRRQHFNHPVYSQHGGGEFIPGLSVLDALFNIGLDGVAVLLLNQREKSHER